MELIGLWIKDYKIYSGEHIFDLNCGYKCNFSLKDKTLDISINKTKQINIFANNINLVTIVGCNGSGKTTVIDILNNILKPHKETKFSEENTYCLIFKEGNEFIYKKSQNIEILGENLSAWATPNECKCLAFKAYSDLAFKSLEYYNSYDNIQKIQDQINEEFYYNLLDESEVALTMGRTINKLKQVKFLKDMSYLNYDTFGWEFNIKDCYEHLTNRLRKLFDKNNAFPFTFPIPLSENAMANAFNEVCYSLIDLSENKYNWNFINLQDVLKDILFMTAICDFGFLLGSIEEKYKEKESQRLKVKLKDSAVFNKYYNKQKKIIGNIVQEVVVKYKQTKNKINKRQDLLFTIVEVLNSKPRIVSTKYLKEKLLKECSQNIKNIQSLLADITIIENILNKYFEYNSENYTYILKNKILMKYFKKRVEYDNETNDFSALYITKYKNRQFVREICKYLPNSFLTFYFKFNMYNNRNNTEYTFKNLSNGERQVLKFIADILYCNTRDVYLFDEIDMTWHPEWQRRFISILNDIFSQSSFNSRKINIVLTTHSPIILSDVPTQNTIIIKRQLDKNENIKLYHPKIKTFGANIHSLFREPFILDSSIGDFVESKIRSIMYFINPEICIDEKYEIDKTLDYNYCKWLVSLIGEDFTRQYLNMQLDSKNETNNRLP